MRIVCRRVGGGRVGVKLGVESTLAIWRKLNRLYNRIARENQIRYGGQDAKDTKHDRPG